MYEVRRTMYDLGSSRALRGNLAKLKRRPSYETVIGDGSKGAGADGVCPCTIYDVRFGEFVRIAQIFLMRINGDISQ